jgi:galactokinase/mevalonate kinase-like predicted kinase
MIRSLDQSRYFADRIVGDAGGLDGGAPGAKVADAGGQEFLIVLSHVVRIERLSRFVPGANFLGDELVVPIFVSL